MNVSTGSATVGLLVVLAGWAAVSLCTLAVVGVLWARSSKPATPRERGLSYRVACPACSARPRQACARIDGQTMASPHALRTAIAAGEVDPDPEPDQ